MNDVAGASTLTSLSAAETPRTLDNKNRAIQEEFNSTKIAMRSILRRGSKYQSDSLNSSRKDGFGTDIKLDGKSHKISFKKDGVQVKEVECMYEFDDIYAQVDNPDCCNMF